MIGSDYPQHFRRSRVIEPDFTRKDDSPTDREQTSLMRLESDLVQTPAELSGFQSITTMRMQNNRGSIHVKGGGAADAYVSRLQRKRIHMESADLFDNESPSQCMRMEYKPHELPCFRDGVFVDDEISGLGKEVEGIERHVKSILGQSCVRLICSNLASSCAGRVCEVRKMRVGIVLSGGPAPGGHNVICGAYRMLKACHPQSELIGIMGGISGLFDENLGVVDEYSVNQHMNSGGFDMLWSGRGKFSTTEDFEKAANVCTAYNFDGLIIVGGDGTNSNAANLADYFEGIGHKTKVVGVPKTIDGDLKSPAVECSFGFDTCARTYSELIGNLATDICSSQQVYHVVRVMGRAASHLVLECALQTRPNLVYIGEETQANNISLLEIINEITDLVLKRLERDREYGIILLPEGLIEFIPEISVLISELNEILQTNPGTTVANMPEYLTEDSKKAWNMLPDDIQYQLLADRESSGYIQVAKIQTERFIIALVEDNLRKLSEENPRLKDVLFMPHYFGYEGRCAMPSNFDCNLCYSLGKTAISLISAGLNGYMAVIKNLRSHYDLWQPWGVPLTKLMELQVDNTGSERAGIRRSILSMDDPLLETLNLARSTWRMEDLYRCPGPIQFEGPICDIRNYTVEIPNMKALLWGDNPTKITTACNTTKRVGQLSLLQLYRLRFELRLPKCLEPEFLKLESTQIYNPRDPFTHRQIMMFYPLMTHESHFKCLSVVKSGFEPSTRGKRVGLLFLSRQSPGAMNIVLGMLDRLKKSEGQLFGFQGMSGILNGQLVELHEDNLTLFKNLGGCEIIGRCTDHRLLYKDAQMKVMETCIKNCLDGLVIVGSNLALTEAAMLAEFFLENKDTCATGVIGIPATGSNNLSHELLETNIGFDTSSKLYSNLIGNVLTDAASMPKYWHFIRIMGRAPSYEVLECALQTHPNMALISEEYGSAQKSINDVVQDIADVVTARSAMGKNFGTLLIPDGLLMHLQGIKAFMNELDVIKRTVDSQDHQALLFSMINCQGRFFDRLSGHSKQALNGLPRHIRKCMIRYTAESDLPQIETEYLLAFLVENEMETRRRTMGYKGEFKVIKHYFGYQGRSAMPSNFDANLAYASGQVAVVCIENALTGQCVSMRGLCGPPENWIATTVPFTAMLQIIPAQQEVHHELARARKATKSEEVPIIPSSEINTSSRSYRWMKTAMQQWMYMDHYCNPGPLQYWNKSAWFTTRSLFEEQFEYYQMLKDVQENARSVLDSCVFGVEEEFLRTAYINMHQILVMRFMKEEIKQLYPNVSEAIKQKKLEQETSSPFKDMLKKDTAFLARQKYIQQERKKLRKNRECDLYQLVEDEVQDFPLKYNEDGHLIDVNFPTINLSEPTFEKDAMLKSPNSRSATHIANVVEEAIQQSLKGGVEK